MSGLDPRSLFDGAISCSFPPRLQNVRDIRDVPETQEVYADPDRDESMIIESLERVRNVEDAQSSVWFLEDLAQEQDVAQTLVIEDVKTLTSSDTPLLGSDYVVNAAIGIMAASKGKQGMDAQNHFRVYLANIRLRNVNTDILVTIYEPLLISEQGESAGVQGAGATDSAEAAGVMPASQIFQLVLSTFQIHNLSHFGR